MEKMPEIGKSSSSLPDRQPEQEQQEVEKQAKNQRNLTTLRELLAREAGQKEAPTWPTSLMELLEMGKKHEPINHPKEICKCRPQPDLWFRPILRIIGTASAGAIPVYHTIRWVDFNLLPILWLRALLYAVKFIAKKDQESDAYGDLQRRVEISNRIPDHPNIVRPVHSFTCDEGNFCVAMPLMELGSIRSIMASDFPDGLYEDYIVIALREALKGLSVIHRNGLVHGEICPGNIFINEEPQIKLAFAATIYDHGNDPNPEDCTFIWAAAPEIYYGNSSDYTAKGDIWMIGITALEMTYGKFTSTSRKDLVSLLQRVRQNKLQQRIKSEKQGSPKKTQLQQYHDRLFGMVQSVRFTNAFEKMVKRCLEEDPGKRPTADELLQERVFRNRHDSVDYFLSMIREIRADPRDRD